MFPSLVFLIAKHGTSCIDFVLTFRMYVQLGIAEYILIWNCGFFHSGYVQFYACIGMSATFSTESKLHHLIVLMV